ncbi:MAG: hypothetical protein ACSLFO_08290, partial [Acidimicrobiales bacterium]
MPWVVPDGGPRGPSGTPPEVDEDAGGGRRRLLLVVAAIFGVLALLGATIAFVTDGDGDGENAGTVDTSTTAVDEPATTEV